MWRFDQLIPAPLKAWHHERKAQELRDEMRATCPPAALAAEAIPESIRMAWVQGAAQDCPGLRTDPAAWVIASTALAQFFEVCRLQADGQPCGLPSRAADSIWHVALAAQPTALQDWQQRHFGRVVEHRPDAELGAPMDQALARTWVWACRSEGRAPHSSGVPLLFAADRRLAAPGGWSYEFDPKRCAVGHRDLNPQGRPVGAVHFQPALAVSALLAAGLLTGQESAAAEGMLDAIAREALTKKRFVGDGSGGATGSDGSAACGDGGSSGACGVGGGASCGGGGAPCGGGGGCGGGGS